ncbi:hypothetical protein LCGC14_2438080, partial [marine sediment metagenome]
MFGALGYGYLAAMRTATRHIPKYYRIMQDIVAKIRRQDIATGSPVPSENQLTQAYGVSNTT